MSLPRSSWILLAASLTLTVAFSVWSAVVLGSDRLQPLDTEIAFTFKQTAADDPAVRAVMIGFTHAGGVPAMILLALAGVLWQLQRGDKILALTWFVASAGGGLLNVLVKETFDRPRPPIEWRDEAVTENNESFPSGHAQGSLIGYGMLGYAAVHALRRRSAQIALPVLLAALVAGIGFSRIYLRAHWFSDVVGGFMIGAAWLALIWAWPPWVRGPRSAGASRPTDSAIA